MEDSGDLAAQKEALGLLRGGLQRAIARGKQAPPQADGNVGEVMEREPAIEAAEEGETVEHEMTEGDEEVDETPRRTVLASFSPRSVPQQTLHVKRGPGRPRKVR